MNFDEAVNVHVAWKMKLSAYLRKPDGSLQQGAVCRDDLCALGRWIHGEGERLHGKQPEFPALKAAHAAFHQAAGEVVAKAGQGATVTEEVALGANSPFAEQSKRVVMAIVAMKTQSTKRKVA